MAPLREVQRLAVQKWATLFVECSPQGNTRGTITVSFSTPEDFPGCPSFWSLIGVILQHDFWPVCRVHLIIGGVEFILLIVLLDEHLVLLYFSDEFVHKPLCVLRTRMCHIIGHF